MKLKLLLFIFVIYCSCRNVEKHNYSFETHLYTDSVKYFLFKDMLIIDSAKYVTKYEIINGYTPYQVLNIDIFEQGWSCSSLDTILQYNKKYLNGRFSFENKFINKIIEEEGLHFSDSIKILNYLQDLFPAPLIMSTDPAWSKTVDLFYNEFVFKKFDTITSNYHLDTCEVQMYKNIFVELKSKQKGVFYATTWLPEFLNEQSLAKYNFRIQRIEIVDSHGRMKVKISAGNYIMFR